MNVAAARTLRANLTSQEVKLWIQLRSWRAHGFHFRRQVPRDGYILDFACLKARVIVEADGNQHGFDENRRRDTVRDEHFEKQGFTVLRFSNFDIDRNIESVLETIDAVLRPRS
jgi:very-short-patch-repair endonuclease